MTKKLYLKDQAYEQIKHMIIHGEIDGPVISEQRACRSAGDQSNASERSALASTKYR